MSKGRFFRLLDRFLFGGPVPAACKPLPDCLLTPVLFANGRDIDDEGFRAFLENRPVVFGGSLIAPGPHVLRGYHFSFTAVVMEIYHAGRLVEVHGYPSIARMIDKPGKVLRIDAAGDGQRQVSHCGMLFNAVVQP